MARRKALTLAASLRSSPAFATAWPCAWSPSDKFRDIDGGQGDEVDGVVAPRAARFIPVQSASSAKNFLLASFLGNPPMHTTSNFPPAEGLLERSSFQHRIRAGSLFSPTQLSGCQSTSDKMSTCHSEPPAIKGVMSRKLSTGAALKIDGMRADDVVRTVLELTAELESEYHELMQRLEQGGLAPDELAEIGKRSSNLEPTVTAIQALKSHMESQRMLREVAESEEEEEDLRQMAREEAEKAEGDQESLLREVLECVLPRDEADDRSCILEVRAGTGGDEASLFAMDLFNMYQGFCSHQGWRFEVLDVAEGAMGGYKEASAAVTGEGSYGNLKYESGVHRVQRVPLTERAGRTHTSAATVAVLPQAEEVDVAIREQDLRIDTYRSGGAGGQSVNTTSSAVRITHLPSGIVVAIQDERSQHQNKAKALKILRARLFACERERQAASRSELRYNQIGSGDRSERIRTYNFPQGRVTDHRSGVTLHDITSVLSGEAVDDFIQAMKKEQELKAIQSLGK